MSNLGRVDLSLRFARKINYFATINDEAKFAKCMEIVEVTSNEFFDNFDAFSELSEQCVTILATVEKHLTFEFNLITAIIQWCQDHCESRGLTCRELLDDLGMMHTLRWGCMDTKNLISIYGYIFTREEREQLWRMGAYPGEKLSFINLSDDRRGASNVIRDKHLILSRAPFVSSQKFAYSNSNATVQRIDSIALSARKYKYFKLQPKKQETVAIEVTCGNQFFKAVMLTKSGSSTFYELEKSITLIIAPGDEVTFKFFFSLPGVFQLTNGTYFCGVELRYLTASIIKEIRGAVVREI